MGFHYIAQKYNSMRANAVAQKGQMEKANKYAAKANLHMDRFMGREPVHNTKQGSAQINKTATHSPYLNAVADYRNRLDKTKSSTDNASSYLSKVTNKHSAASQNTPVSNYLSKTGGQTASTSKGSSGGSTKVTNVRTLFIEYDLSIGSMLTPVYRLMFDLALKEALGRNKSQGHVYLICDEFRLLPHLRHIDDGVNFGRSLGVKVFAGVQSIEQLYEIYGQSRGRNIAAGFSSIYAFRANDVATRDYVTGLFGKNIVLEKYQRLDNQMTEDKRNGQTVEDWDMNTLNVGEAIVGLPFSHPFRFHFDIFK